MAGEEAAARSTAKEARALPTQPLHRQVRGILSRESSWSTILEVLEAESRAIPTPAARCHDALLAGEISRLCLNDDEGAKKRLDQAMRFAPTDPRAHLQRFAEALGAAEPEADMPSAASKVRFPEGPEMGPLAKGAAQVLAHRGQGKAPRPRNRVELRGAPPRARLRRRRGPARPPSPGSKVWCAPSASPAAPAGSPHPSPRPARRPAPARSRRCAACSTALTRPSPGAPSPPGPSSWATPPPRARPPRPRALPPSTRGRSHRPHRPHRGHPRRHRSRAQRGLQRRRVSPIAAAASAAVGDQASPDRIPYPVGSMQSRTAVTLGRTLAARESTESVAGAVAAFADASPESGLARTLSLEMDLDLGNGGRVARAVGAWRGTEGEGAPGKGPAPDRRPPGRSTAPRRSTIACARSTSATRPRAAPPPRTPTTTGAARILAEHAQALEGGSGAAVLLTEAAVREAQTGDDSESEILLRRAIEVDPALPFARALGERAARAHDDRSALIEWIRARREAADDPLEQAYDLVREALLLAESDGAAAAALLEQALKARPADISLRELFERLSPEPPPDRRLARRARRRDHARRGRTRPSPSKPRSSWSAPATWRAQRAAPSRPSPPVRPCSPPSSPTARPSPATARATWSRPCSPAPARARIASRSWKCFERMAELDERGRTATPGAPCSGAAPSSRRRRATSPRSAASPPRWSAPAATRRDHRLRDRARPRGARGRGPRHALGPPAPPRHWDDTRDPVEIAYRSEPPLHLGPPADGGPRPRQGRVPGARVQSPS